MILKNTQQEGFKLQNLVVVLCIVISCFHMCEGVVGPLTDSSLGDEWLGPLPGWLNVTQFGAKGNGIADDTAAIQSALNAAMFNQIIYFPSGTYRITAMLNMTSQHYSTITGEDPTTTIIKYDGPPCFNNTFDCVMLYTNGVDGMRFARLTWDGNNKIHTCVQNRWDGCVNGYSGDSVHSDEIFKNAYFGLRAGSNHGPYCGPNGATAEWSVTRCQFINLSQAGYSVEDWNALDWFIRQSIFMNCAVGITDIYGEGGMHGYENQFFSSTVADFAYGNCGYFSVRDNFSYNSSRFLIHYNSGCSNIYSIQRNIVVAPYLANNTGLLYFGGPDDSTITDNVFVTPPNYVGPAIIWEGPYSGHGGSLSINNTYCVNGNLSSAVVFLNQEAGTHRGISIGDINVSPRTIVWTQPTIPGFQPISTRPLYVLPPPLPEVNTQQIQSVIDKLAPLAGKRAIIYLTMGEYKINTSLVFPPNSDIQLVGRERASWYASNATLIGWHGPKTDDPILLLQGPSKVTIKHLTINGNNLANGIRITNADQIGGRVYSEDFNPYGPSTHNIFANGLDHTHLDFYQLYDHGLINSTGILAVGGPCAAKGLGDFRIAGFGGATSSEFGASTLYDVKNGGRLSITDTWYEGPGRTWLNMENSQGQFSFSGGNVSPYTDGQNTISINDFEGNILLNALTVVYNGSVSNVGGNSSVLFAGMSFLASYLHFANTGQDVNTVICTLFVSGNPNQNKTFLNNTIDPTQAFGISKILDAFQLVRSAHRVPPGPADGRPDGITDVRMFRNWEVFTPIALQVDGDLNQTVCLNQVSSGGARTLDNSNLALLLFFLTCFFFVVL